MRKNSVFLWHNEKAGVERKKTRREKSIDQKRKEEKYRDAGEGGEILWDRGKRGLAIKGPSREYSRPAAVRGRGSAQLSNKEAPFMGMTRTGVREREARYSRGSRKKKLCKNSSEDDGNDIKLKKGAEGEIPKLPSEHSEKKRRGQRLFKGIDGAIAQDRRP